MTTSLPNNLLVRAPTWDDLHSVADLIIACDIADTGKPDYSVEQLRDDWEREPFSLALDACVILTADGQIIGYTDVCPSQHGGMFISQNTCVHPAYRGHSLERELYRLSEARARQPRAETGEDALSSIWTVSTTQASNRVLEEEGYHATLVETRMEIDLDTQPPAPEWPEGVQVRTFVPGVDEGVVHQVIQEAFKDIGTREYLPLEDWVDGLINRNDFDPTLVFLVLANEEVVAAVLCYNYPEGGWIRQLGVLPSWRRQGLGMGLLRHAFGEYYRRGTYNIGLGVDPGNLTCAPRLYERAGMHVVASMVTYEKDLRSSRG